MAVTLVLMLVSGFPPLLLLSLWLALLLACIATCMSSA